MATFTSLSTALRTSIVIIALFTSLPSLVAARLNVASTSSIQSTASTLASTLLSMIPPNTPDGLLPAPYYWWESGGLWGTVLTYWHLTGDAQYNNAAIGALSANVGAGNDFMGGNTQGNDDQGWWALTAMDAAEYGLPASQSAAPWLDIAKNVYNEMAGRWDTTTCNGGLKWKISEAADYIGYHYKNAVSNALYFQLSARLYKLTGDATYAGTADEVFSWMQSINMIDKDTWAVYDGSDDRLNCAQLDHDRWSYNVGLLLYGSAVMQAMPNSDAKWASRTNGLMGATARFFDGSAGVMQETKCEPTDSCNTDQLSFKAYLARYMAASAGVLPSLADQIVPLLTSSAGGAVASCSGGPGGSTCGTKWTVDSWDGTSGAGQQLAALEVVHGLLTVQGTVPAAPSAPASTPSPTPPPPAPTPSAPPTTPTTAPVPSPVSTWVALTALSSPAPPKRISMEERRWNFSWGHGGHAP